MSDAAFFSSFLAERLTAYVALRRSLGYEFRGQVYLLRQFDRVVAHEMPASGPVSREVVAAYLSSLAHLRPTTRRVRLCMIRQFLRYLQQSDPNTYIPERAIEPGHASPRCPYIFSEAEIRALVEAAHHYPARYRSRRWLLYPTLFALLYVTGMRISETLGLTLRDVDLRDAIVRIRKTKFHKSRLIPLQESTCAALRRYLLARAERGHSTESDAPLFVNGEGQHIPYKTVHAAFHASARNAGIEGSGVGLKPRIHDLRHTAAVRCLHLWYREGKNVQALLPVLVTYLGHSSVASTAIYLTTTAELLAEASARFESAFDNNVDSASPGGTR
jgi:site-specific recombinase XerD